ncbi:hypothetical protein PHISP_04171 [Aspergillus sp. HF37]|nr:hypothetical protein PHISP_04171 [Aspergillus sp. HF37]
MVFLATTLPGDSGEKPLGSFVYAMPDRTSPRTALSTTLCPSQSSEEYATRVAKILATRMDRPVYVGSSIKSEQLGLTVEEEMEGVRSIVDAVMGRWMSEWGRYSG